LLIDFLLILGGLVGAALLRVFLRIFKAVDDGLSSRMLRLDVLFGEEAVEFGKDFVIFVFVG
jgi:hypothetical protein